MKNNCQALAVRPNNISNMLGRLHERQVFFSRFIHSPRYIGSITPSSYYLAQAMINPVPWGKIRSVAELGAGTGVFTHYINHYKRDDCQAFIFEQDDLLRERLSELYPDLIYYTDAEDIYHVAGEMECLPLDCVLSGLPFANFPPRLRDNIINGVLDSLKPGGQFITFQYSLQMKPHLQKSFRRVDITFVPFNFLPAFVYTCYK